MLYKSNNVAKKRNITESDFFYFFKHISLHDYTYYRIDADIIYYEKKNILQKCCMIILTNLLLVKR